MSGVPQSKLELVRRLLAGAPDGAVRSLETALAGASGDLSAIRDLVRHEKNDRALRSAVFSPLLGKGPGVLPDAYRFTSTAAAQAWSALARDRGELLEAAREAQADRRVTDPDPAVFDDLCLAAADLAETAAAPLGPDAALALRFAPLVRGALDRSGAWLGRADAEQAAALRLLLKDAASLTEDGAPRFLNLVSTHLEPPALLLRFVSAALGRPNDNYLASSELAALGEALLDALDAAVDRVRRFMPSQDRKSVV